MSTKTLSFSLTLLTLSACGAESTEDTSSIPSPSDNLTDSGEEEEDVVDVDGAGASSSAAMRTPFETTRLKPTSRIGLKRGVEHDDARDSSESPSTAADKSAQEVQREAHRARRAATGRSTRSVIRMARTAKQIKT